MKALGTALGITLSFFVVELIGGFLTNSLVLQTDAVHMFNDSFALVFALVAAWLAKRPMNSRKTYGYYRAEILAAFLNGIFLWVVVAFVLYEATQRILAPTPVRSVDMLIIAVLGLVANGFSAFALSGRVQESLNVKGAYLHVISDTLGSIGAISAGIIMSLTGWYSVDSLISIAIAMLIFYNSGKLVRESLDVLLEGAPAHIDVDVLQQRLVGMRGIKSIHDLHVWCITPTRMCSMSCHVVVDREADRKRLTSDIIEILKQEFGIDHTTIQLEDEGYPKATSEH